MTIKLGSITNASRTKIAIKIEIIRKIFTFLFRIKKCGLSYFRDYYLSKKPTHVTI